LQPAGWGGQYGQSTKSADAPRWAAPIGLVTAAAGFIGMFRNVTSSVALVASINNYLLAVWMITLGVVLLRYLNHPNHIHQERENDADKH
jgi:uncharacterized membrane protein HdeD (DUF308 family)